MEAYGAVVAGYARQLAVGPAVAAVKRFHASGGSPDAAMLDILANIAIRSGDYRVAMQACARGGGGSAWQAWLGRRLAGQHAPH